MNNILTGVSYLQYNLYIKNACIMDYIDTKWGNYVGTT